MPTLLGHVAVPLLVGTGIGQRRIPYPLVVAGIVLATLPDLDVVGFRLGIPYASVFGHRGMSHSLSFAGFIALLCTAMMRTGRQRPLAAFTFLFFSAASHGLLDCLTDGGKGIALLWPFSDERYFAPIRIIRVSPIGLSQFISERGWLVFKSELLWIWLPGLILTMSLRACRSRPRWTG